MEDKRELQLERRKRGGKRTEREKKRARAQEREERQRQRENTHNRQKNTKRTTGAQRTRQRPNPRTIMKGSTPPHGCRIREEVDEYRLVMIFLVLKRRTRPTKLVGGKIFFIREGEVT
jgi:hypothetical protein